MRWGPSCSRFWEGALRQWDRARGSLQRSLSIIRGGIRSFRPNFPAPLVLWRDDGSRATSWSVEAIFADGGPPIRVEARGERMRVGPIDARCVSPTNELPKLTAEQAAARTWRPDAETWRAIKQAVRGCRGYSADHRVRGRQSAARGVARTGEHPDVQRSGGRTDLLPRRAADAGGDGEGRDQAAGRRARSR